MAALTLKDLTAAVGGLLGPKADAYSAGVGAAASAGALKLSDTVKSFLYKQGEALGKNIGIAGAVLPGVVAAGAAGSGRAAQDEFEAKFLGLSVTNMIIVGVIVLGGLILWMLRSKR